MGDFFYIRKLKLLNNLPPTVTVMVSSTEVLNTVLYIWELFFTGHSHFGFTTIVKYRQCLFCGWCETLKSD